MRVVAGLFLVMALLSFASPIADAHFKLLAPQSWITENNLGDPQKLGPCGGTSADGGVPTNFINKIQGGQKLHLKLQETVFHPGHYRVALAINSPTELPLDPQTTTRDSDRGPISVSAAIQEPPQIPVLADGLLVHSTRPTGQVAPSEAD